MFPVSAWILSCQDTSDTDFDCFLIKGYFRLYRKYYCQFRKFHFLLTHTVTVLRKDWKLWARDLSPLYCVWAGVQSRWQKHPIAGTHHSQCWTLGGNLGPAYFEHLSHAVMNHIKQNKTAAQTNPPFSWVSSQLHYIWGKMDISWLNQCLHAEGILVDPISQKIHAQMDSSNCYAHPFLLLIYLQLDLFLRSRIINIHTIETRVSIISMQKQTSLVFTDSTTT